MRANLLSRRLEMTKLRNSGLPLSSTVKNLSDKYDVTTRAIYRDWSNRKTWLKTILELKDPETVFLDLLSRHNQIYNMAVLEHLKADNSNARVGALNLMRNINKDFVDMIVLRGLSEDVEAIKSHVGMKQ